MMTFALPLLLLQFMMLVTGSSMSYAWQPPSPSPLSSSLAKGPALFLAATTTTTTGRRLLPTCLTSAHTGSIRRGTRRMTPTCGLQVTIHIRGKRTGGEEWLNDGYEEYVKRLRPVLSLETVWHKTDDDMVTAVQRERSSSRGQVVCMDERGKMVTSTEFADALFKQIEIGGSRLSIVIGGAEGLPPSLKQHQQHGGGGMEFWSLGRMTLTHQWARVLLAEQIYRATEIRKGSGYHKD